MSYVFNMIGGGTGGGGPTTSDAILTVTVPTGSTVTMTKGGVTLTPTMWVQAADATLDCALFVIGPSLFDAQNAWTVTASLSGDTASGTVTIDSNEQYDMELRYSYWLYKDGNEETAITGGYVGRTQSNSSWSLESDHIYLGFNSAGTGSKAVTVYTNNQIDFTDYSYLKAYLNRTTVQSGNSSSAAEVCLLAASTNTQPVGKDYATVKYHENNTTKPWPEGYETLTVDVSSVSGSYYVGLFSGNYKIDVYRIWMEA